MEFKDRNLWGSRLSNPRREQSDELLERI